MLIAESNLRKIVREMLLEADDPDQVSAAGFASAGVAERAADRVSAGMMEKFRSFISSVLAGGSIVTRSKNTIDQNLFVRAFLDYYGRQFGQGDKLLTTVGLGTSYPEAAVKSVQKSLGLQVDGDFGRQTMAALATGGAVKLSPTTIERLRSNEKLRDLVALATANGIVADDFDAVKAALERVSAQPQASQIPTATKKSSMAGSLPDAPATAVRTISPPPAVSTGASPQINIRRR